jgi:thiamine-phosphate pyrophosphorylase
VRALYVTDRAAIGDERFRAILESLAGASGLRVQLRERGVPDHEILCQARGARQALGPSVPLYVSRRFDIALAAGADGVHLPADGLPIDAVRRGTPRGFRIGISTHAASEAVEAIGAGADLVVIGPIFDTPSKRAYGPPLGPGALSALPPLSDHAAEIYAIGGIDERNLPQLDAYRDRISGFAAIRMFQDAADARAVLERLVAR